MKQASSGTMQGEGAARHGRRPLWWSVRERILETRLGGRSVRDLVFPAYVRLYPWLFCMWSFEYEGRRYGYKFHPYGATIRGERIVEVPIALEELKANAGRRILEVGNVLSHYVPCDHVVVDKYEQSDRCLNVDIMDFYPPHRFDYILSISTVEHIGWNEHEQEPDKAVRALLHMKSLLAPGGRMLVTVPWGENPALDRHLRSAECMFDELRYMKRVSSRNTWVQADAGVLEQACYGRPYPFANALVLGYLGSRLGEQQVGGRM